MQFKHILTVALLCSTLPSIACSDEEIIQSAYLHLPTSLDRCTNADKDSADKVRAELKNDFKGIYRKRLTKEEAYDIIDKYEEKSTMKLFYDCGGEKSMPVFALLDLMVRKGYINEDPTHKYYHPQSAGKPATTAVTSASAATGTDEGESTVTAPKDMPYCFQSWSLAGRLVTGKVARPVYDKLIEGKVVMIIQVDKKGYVKKTTIGEGTTITDPTILEAAQVSAMSTKFSPRDDGKNGDQSGTITYYFKLQ